MRKIYVIWFILLIAAPASLMGQESSGSDIPEEQLDDPVLVIPEIFLEVSDETQESILTVIPSSSFDLLPESSLELPDIELPDLPEEAFNLPEQEGQSSSESGLVAQTLLSAGNGPALRADISVRRSVFPLDLGFTFSHQSREGYFGAASNNDAFSRSDAASLSAMFSAEPLSYELSLDYQDDATGLQVPDQANRLRAFGLEAGIEHLSGANYNFSMDILDLEDRIFELTMKNALGFGYSTEFFQLSTIGINAELSYELSSQNIHIVQGDAELRITPLELNWLTFYGSGGFFWRNSFDFLWTAGAESPVSWGIYL
jgi:hypothetical protein